MTGAIGLTQEERTVAERYIARLERSARNCTRRRVYTVLGVLAVACCSVRCTYDFLQAMDSEPLVSEHFQKIEIPADAPRDLWITAEFRRSVAVLEVLNRVQMLGMAEGVLGLVLGVFAAGAAVLVVTHWNDGPIHGVLAKALRWQLAQEGGGPAGSAVGAAL